MSVDLTVSPFATVTGRVYRDYGVSDGPVPDAVPGSGFVVFTPVLLAGDAAPVGVPQAQRVMAPIDPATGVVGPVLLWAGSWQVRVPGVTMPGEVVLEAGQSYDLAALRGYVPGPGVSVTTLEVPAPSGSGYLSTDGTTLSWADAVDSVNGRTGTVVLGAADVGAEPAGSMVAHMGAADPHPQYLTPAEGDGRYLPASYSPPASGELTGTGMPNGVVTANPGIYYTDTAGTNGAWRWLKKSGTGNTGWEVIVGDTGWRAIAVTFITGGELDLRRVNNLCYVSNGGGYSGSSTFSNLSVGGNTGGLDNPIPQGWRTSTACSTPITNDGNSHAGYLLLTSTTDYSVVQVRGAVATSISYGRMVLGTYAPSDPWPTTLPGTPA